MATNFIAKGDVITVVSPSGGVSSGDMVFLGAALGVATHDAAAGEDLELAIKGVFNVPFTAGDTVAAGDAVYITGGGALTTASTGNTLAATAAGAKASGVATCDVRFHGGPVA